MIDNARVSIVGVSMGRYAELNAAFKNGCNELMDMNFNREYAYYRSLCEILNYHSLLSAIVG